jgi:uncharacterized membrane protein YozB (DUF420 family)
MYTGLLHAHSGLRWVALILLIYTVINAFQKKSSGDFTEKDRKITVFTLMSVHIQIVLGIVLYFISPKVSFAPGFMKDTVMRFFAMEHILLMLIAAVLITIGHVKVKKAEDSAKKFKLISTFFLIGLLLIIAAIPWPFRGLGSAWF